MRAVIRVLRRENTYNWKFTALLAAWFTYQLQSLISVNQLGLGIWGWTLTGLLIGYEINTRHTDKAPDQKLDKGSGRTTKLPSAKARTDWQVILFSMFGFILGGLIAIAPFLNSFELRKLSFNTTVIQLEELTTRKTIDPEISVFVAEIFVKNKLEENALRIVQNTVKNYPNNYLAWKLYAAIPSATPQEIAQAQIQMKRLDPLNPELK